METYVEEHTGRVFLDEKEFPDDLEGRLSSVLNAVNIELKTVTLLHLDDRPADHLEIRDRIRDTMRRGYLPWANVFRGYGETLQSIALVAKQTIVRDDGETQVLGYSLTEAGKKYGVPIAEYVLKWVVDNGLSMYSILGATQSQGETRSPDNRVGVLEALSTKKASEGELATLLDLDSTNVERHLKKLKKIGFIEFDSVGVNRKGFSTYIWIEGKNPKDVIPVRYRPTLTKKVTREISKGPEFNCHTLAKKIKHERHREISKVLSSLKRQGFLRKTTNYEIKVILSEAGILELGERFLEEVLYPVKEHLSDSIVLETDFGERDSEYVARGIDIYRKVSPYLNKKSSSERIQQIRSYLSKNPGVTSREVADALDTSPGNIRKYLGQMDGLRIEKEGSEIRYFLDDGNVE